MTGAALRILDANLNRAREALRVLEDYARFALDDAQISASVKALRHELASATTLHAGHALLLRIRRPTSGRRFPPRVNGGARIWAMWSSLPASGLARQSGSSRSC